MPLFFNNCSCKVDYSILDFELLYGIQTQVFNFFITSVFKSGILFHIYVLKLILETVYVIAQLGNTVFFLWLDQTIQLQLFFILATISLNPLNCTFYKNFSVSPAKYANLLLYLRCFHFFLSKLSEKAYKRRHGHCDRKCYSSFGRFS